MTNETQYAPAMLGFNMAAVTDGDADAVTPQYGNLPRTETPPSPPFGPNEPGDTLRQNGQVYAIALPHISCLIINVKPDNVSQMLEVYTLAIREELLHGIRKRFGLTRNVHLLHQECTTALFKYLRGNLTAKRAAERIIPCQIAAHDIVSVQNKYLEAIDQYLNRKALEDKNALRNDVESFMGTGNQNIDQICDQLQDRKNQIETRRDDTRNDDVYETLGRLGDRFEPVTAQHVADAVLDVPYAIEPGQVDISRLESTRVDTVSLDGTSLRDRLSNRLEQAVEIVEDHSDPVAAGPDLKTQLQPQIRQDSGSTPTERIQDISLPLLDEPTQVSESGAQFATRSPPGSVDKVLSAAFQLPGNFGGCIFWNDMDPNWQLNPLIDHQQTEPGYRQRWETSYVSHRLIEQLKYKWWMVDGAGNMPGQIEHNCPLCELSHDGHRQCPYDESKNRLNEVGSEILDRFRLIDSRHYDGRLFDHLRDTLEDGDFNE